MGKMHYFLNNYMIRTKIIELLLNMKLVLNVISELRNLVNIFSAFDE